MSFKISNTVSPVVNFTLVDERIQPSFGINSFFVSFFLKIKYLILYIGEPAMQVPQFFYSPVIPVFSIP